MSLQLSDKFNMTDIRSSAKLGIPAPATSNKGTDNESTGPEKDASQA